MSREGVTLLGDVRDLAHIGPRESIVHIWSYYRTFRDILRETERQRPPVAILLDFPEFNLRLAKRLKRMGVKVIYYISPQLWAWRRGRIRLVQRYVDKMLVILPFEEEYYRRRGVVVEFVGHPILEEFAPQHNRGSFLGSLGLDPARRTLAILPGSRRKEIGYMLPDFVKAARIIRQRTGSGQCLVSVAPTVGLDLVRDVMIRAAGQDYEREGFRLVTTDSRDILANSDFAMVKSGTSTVEAALVGTPFLIAYKLSRISWTLGHRLVDIPFKGLVNLIAGEEVVPEFIQDEVTAEALSSTAVEFLMRPDKAKAMKCRLAEIRSMLSSRCASDVVAATVSSYL